MCHTKTYRIFNRLHPKRKRWTLETFKLGYSRDIKDNDLYAPLPEHRSDVLGDAVQKAWDREVKVCRDEASVRKPSLWRVLFKVYGSEFLCYGLILAAMEFLIRLQQPLFLGLLLRYYSPVHQELNNNTTTQYTYFSRLFNYYDAKGSIAWGEAVFFAFGIVFCSAFNVMVQHPFMMGVMHTGMKMRVGVCSLIYRKALKVSLQNMTESSGGLVVNLMANDVNRFDTGPIFAHYLWIGPLETLLMTVYLYREMGMSAVFGSVVIFAVIPFQIFLGTRTAYYRKGTALKSDERVKLMKEIIMGMEVIKMYTWEQPFRLIIDTVRRREIYFIKMTSYIRGVIMSFIMFTSRFGIFIIVLIYVTFVNRITVENVFFLTCYYNITKQTMTLYFPQAVGQIAEMNVAVQRIRDYLLSEECQLPPRLQPEHIEVINDIPSKRVTILDKPIRLNRRNPRNRNEATTSQTKPREENYKEMNKDEVVIKFENAYSRWIKSTGKDDVHDLNLNIHNGSLTCIIGAVGSGKSTLLHMVLSELPCSSGSMEVIGDVSYASQDPWLFVGSVRQNILFGQSFHKSRYMEVCKVCALERDISLFPHGDKTIIGERGVSLSGGQRARINLARAVYKEDQEPEAEFQTIGRVRGSVYKEYFVTAAPCPFVSLVCFLFVLAQFCASACDYWISRWSHAEDTMTGDATMDNVLWSEQGLDRNGFVLIFGLITITTIIVALIRAFTFFSLCMKSSIKLHDKMFEYISRSPMSFFHANPSGRILNRFSKDMGAVDELLPQAMIDCFQILLNLLGVLVVILMTDISLLIPTTTALIIFYLFRVIYIRTSGAVKRLEGITRSPVFGHLNATVQGLATVRSFGAEYLLGAEFDRHQDLHSAAWYLFISCSRAFGYFLDVICLLFIICVTFSCLMKIDIDGSKVGLAITQSISLTGIFQWGMRQSAEMENQMTSVERVIEYTKLPQEPSLRSIGIVGRTGAGKSSIIQALFRLAYLEGTITIDGVDLSTIGLHDLREKISIIPQEPVLFSGTMRKNLDPFDDYSDELLLKVLQNVELQSDDEGIGALYKQVSEGGSNFSVGERQLVCLARAIVHNDRILVLDEATANVDAQTDALIQTAIKEHFKDCTVLTIAHRLNTVIDSHKILVLDAGRLVEYDHPHVLLQNRKGYFRRMVAETGPAMAPVLHKLAAQSYKNAKRMND